MPIIRLLPLPRTSLLRPSRAFTHHHHHHNNSRLYSSTFQTGPSPPRLPADQQAEFERLQRAVSDRINDPTPLPHEQPQQQASSSSSSSTPSPSPANTSRHISTPSSSSTAQAQAQTATVTSASPTVKEDEVIPTSVRRGAKPEFEGDTNPKTGEVGGPKNEPLRWGSGGDWSYNGRVTDF